MHIVCVMLTVKKCNYFFTIYENKYDEAPFIIRVQVK